MIPLFKCWISAQQLCAHHVVHSTGGWHPFGSDLMTEKYKTFKVSRVEKKDVVQMFGFLFVNYFIAGLN